MDEPLVNQVRAELRAMRESGAKNHELIEAALQASYFTLEVEPTVRSVIDLVAVPGKSPTTQTVAKHLSDFKTRLRQRLKIRLALPEIPKAIAEQVETAMAALIESCQVAARSSMEEDRQQIMIEADEKVRKAEELALEAQAKAETYQEHISRLDEQYSALQLAYEAALIDVAKSKGQVEEIKQAVAKLQSDLNQASSEKMSLTREIELTKQHYETRLSETESKHGKTISEKDAEISKLSGILQMADKDLINTRMHLQNSQAAREDMKDELDQLRLKYEHGMANANSIQAQLREEIKELHGSVGVLKGRAIAAEEQRLSFESVNQQLQRENARLSTALEFANQKIDQLTAKQPRGKSSSKG